MAKKIINKIGDEVLNMGKDYIEKKVTNKLEKKIYKISEFSILVLVGFILISIGFAKLITYIFPKFNETFSFLIIGFIYIILGFLIKK